MSFSLHALPDSFHHLKRVPQLKRLRELGFFNVYNTDLIQTIDFAIAFLAG